MRTLLAVLGGAAIGAGCALLLAPQTGAQTRAMIKDKSNKLSHDAMELAESKGHHLRNKMQGCAHMAQDLVEKAQEAMPQVQSMVNRAANVIHKTKSSMDAMPEPEPATTI